MKNNLKKCSGLKEKTTKKPQKIILGVSLSVSVIRVHQLGARDLNAIKGSLEK